MKIMIHRDGVDYGPYSPEEVRSSLARGELQDTDMAWPEGATEWKPLQDVLSQTSGAKRSIFSDSPKTSPEASPITASRKFPNMTAMVVVVFLALLAGILIAESKQFGEAFDLLGMLYPSSKTTQSFTEFTATITGDHLAAKIKTDDDHADTLCDQVMDKIYDLSCKNPAVSTIDFTVQAGQKVATVHVDNLDIVRHYHDGEHYDNSPHRAYVGQPLVDAGIINASSLATKVLHGSADDLIGTSYQLTPSAGSPRLGVKFIDSMHAQILADGTPVGDVCNYTVDGDLVTIPTSCSTMHLQIKGRDLISPDTAGLTLSPVDQ